MEDYSILDAASRPYGLLYDRLAVSFEAMDRANSLHNIDATILGEAENIPFPDASFDVSLCTEVLMYMYSQSKVIHKIYRVLKLCGACF